MRIVFKHRRELREWAWRHSAMFAEKTQYMFLILCGQWIKRRWFWWAHKNHYSTQNYKIQGCKILFITNSIWRRSRWGWGWEVPDKKVETLVNFTFDKNLFQNIGFPRHNKNWYKCQRWDLSQRNLNFSLYLYLDLYFSLSLSEFFAKTDSGMLASLVNIVNDAMSVKDKLCWHLSTTCWWHWITQGWSFGYLF